MSSSDGATGRLYGHQVKGSSEVSAVIICMVCDAMATVPALADPVKWGNDWLEAGCDAHHRERPDTEVQP